MATDLLYFDGVSISKDQMSGAISSDQLIKAFNKDWIPFYQRGRVMSKKKIQSLIGIYKSKGKIDSIKLNLEGEYTYDKKRGEALLEGQFSVIDGQQRLWSLMESKVTDIKIPVELYLNLSQEEQIRLFQQYNKEPTKLTIGELAKSSNGPVAQAVRPLLNKKDSIPIRLSINASAEKLSLATFSQIVYQVHRRLYRDLKIMNVPSGKTLLKFLDDPSYPGVEVALSIFGARQILQASVDVFGAYDAKASVYRRAFFTAWFQLLINNFMGTSGKVEFGKFKSKIKEIPTLSQNAQIRELIRSGGTGANELIYNKMVDHLNFKLKHGHLEKAQEIVQSEKAMEHVVGRSRTKYNSGGIPVNT
jgi:hypothetical protein